MKRLVITLISLLFISLLVLQAQVVQWDNEKKIDRIKEMYYFRGQVDAKNGVWKIEEVLETGAFEWIDQDNPFTREEVEFLLFLENRY